MNTIQEEMFSSLKTTRLLYDKRLLAYGGKDASNQQHRKLVHNGESFLFSTKQFRFQNARFFKGDTVALMNVTLSSVQKLQYLVYISNSYMALNYHSYNIKLQ